MIKGRFRVDELGYTYWSASGLPVPVPEPIQATEVKPAEVKEVEEKAKKEEAEEVPWVEMPPEFEPKVVKMAKIDINETKSGKYFKDNKDRIL